MPETTVYVIKSTTRAYRYIGMSSALLASQTTIEDRTPSFAIFGLQAERDWLDGLITTSLRFNNLSDRYYFHHTSIGNIPENGFNVMGVIRINGGKN